MGWFRRPRHDPEEFERLKQQLSYMREQFDKAEGSRTELHQRVESIGAAAVRGDDVASLSARVDELRTKIDVWTKSQHARGEQLTALDRRVTAVSTELANQLSELSGDIEKLADSPSGATDPVAVRELAVGQERLANEQARYQIAFREDLARLAEELRRAAR
jgi:chromosome segregation ATPase